VFNACVVGLVLRALRVGSEGCCGCWLACDSGSEQVVVVEGSAGAIAVV